MVWQLWLPAKPPKLAKAQHQKKGETFAMQLYFEQLFKTSTIHPPPAPPPPPPPSPIHPHILDMITLLLCAIPLVIELLTCP